MILSTTAASTAAPALSSMLIYLLMAIVLVVRPEGLFPASRQMTASLNARNIVIVALVIAGLLLLPLYAALSGNVFLLTLFTRIVIFALAAVSLNLILGYGGMVSFGHAAYLGIGGYAVGILAHEGIGSGFMQWPVALAGLGAVRAGDRRAVSLRTRGVYFIMITLAFAQMAYYVASGLARYGGDDGLTIYKRSEFGGLLDLSNRVQFYYLCLVCLLGGVYLIWRARQFALRHGGPGRCAPTNGACGDRLSDVPLPARLLRHRRHASAAWPARCSPTTPSSSARRRCTGPRSGDLIVMVVLGGMGSLFGPMIGAIALLVLEEFAVAGMHRNTGS